MATETALPKVRERGSVRRMRDRYQVRVSAGEDPSTGDRIILVDSVPIEKPGNERSKKAALAEAEKRRTRLLADADELKVARTRATVGALLDRCMAQIEIAPTTRTDLLDQLVVGHRIGAPLGCGHRPHPCGARRGRSHQVHVPDGVRVRPQFPQAMDCEPGRQL